jgi:hypothetical protein
MTLERATRCDLHRAGHSAGISYPSCVAGDSPDSGITSPTPPPGSDGAQAVESIDPRRVHLPPAWRGSYKNLRADQLQRENRDLGLPHSGGFVRSMVELEAEAERQSRIYAGRSRIYGSLYYLFGLPAAILAAIAGATALASTTGRVAAGIIALTSSALSAAVVFLDSGKQRDRSGRTRAYWDDLYNEIHVARLTKLIAYDTYSGPDALNHFYMCASSIRAGRDPEDEQRTSASAGGSGGDPPPLLFPRD